MNWIQIGKLILLLISASVKRSKSAVCDDDNKKRKNEVILTLTFDQQSWVQQSLCTKYEYETIWDIIHSRTVKKKKKEKKKHEGFF